jgi:hypothetical protein
MGEELDTGIGQETSVSGMTEYRQQQIEMRERTARLRELRLQQQRAKRTARASSDDRKSA